MIEFIKLILYLVLAISCDTARTYCWKQFWKKERDK